MTGDRRKLLILVGVAVVAVLAGLTLPRIFLGGDDGGGDELTTTETTSAPSGGGFSSTPSGTGATPAPGPSGPVVDDVTGTELFSTKDPFVPLVDIDAAGTGEGSTEGSTDGSTDTTVPDDTTDTTVPDDTPDATTVPDDTTDTTTGGTGTGSGPSAAGSSISLVDVYPGADGEAVANVEVDEELFTVAAGESFADRYTAVSLSADAGTATFRDADGDFTLTEGEAQLK